MSQPPASSRTRASASQPASLQRTKRGRPDQTAPDVDTSPKARPGQASASSSICECIPLGEGGGLPKRGWVRKEDAGRGSPARRQSAHGKCKSRRTWRAPIGTADPYIALYACMHACMYVCIYVCMYVYMLYVCYMYSRETRKTIVTFPIVNSVLGTF